MQTVMLADGPHQLEPPRIPELIALQRLGYSIGEMFGNALLTSTGKVDEDGDEQHEINIAAVTDHLAVLLAVSEPHVGWTADKVADLLTLDTLLTSYKVLNTLGREGFADDAPKAP